ncbi:MAG: catalase [Clostridia bacterium]|nr:catalase [Clostridia bacterium]
MNAWRHFKTITRHRHEVIKNCARAGILWQGLFHDLSKYSPSEFLPGIRFYQGDKSPNEMERRQNGYSLAWMHHKGRNRHHFEYWTDYNPQIGRYGPVKMPIKYVKEMFCDRVAASKIYQGKNYTDSHPIEYFNRGRANRLIHPETSDFIEKLLVMLSEQGEEKTFEYIRQVKEY